MKRQQEVALIVVYACLLAALHVKGYAETEHRLTGQAMASSGKNAYRAKMAIDGDLETRWSSTPDDDAWWQMAFDRPERLAGLKIVWETAYGEDYEIQVSDDGTQWQTVWEKIAGDGKTDWAFFEPVRARFLRIQGRRRGTGWGYSIWEVSLLTASEWPMVEADDTVAGSDPQRVIDGKAKTYWRSATPAPNNVIVTLPYAIELGGLEIAWGAEFATSYSVALETADGQWHRVQHVDQGGGKREFIYFPAMSTARIRVELEQSHRNRGYTIDEIELKGKDEQSTPIYFYRTFAQEHPRGWYPRWLYREQEFWTITGVPGDTEESLLGESGTFEPYKDGFTVMPFLQVGSRLVSWADANTTQALAEDTLPLPSVTWTTDTGSLHIESVSFGAAGASSTAVRYRLTARDDQVLNGEFILAVRPPQLNPKWQGSGFSPIRTVEAVSHSNGQSLRINGQERIIAAAAASQVVAIAFAQGTVLDCVHQGDCPTTRTATDKEGRCEAALVYDVHLEPGEHYDVVLVFPLHDTALAAAQRLSLAKDPAAFFEQRVQEQRDYWHTLLNRFAITIPEPKLIHMLQSNLAYILLNQDGPWIKPGSRRYNHTWIRDGSMTSVALLRMGITEPVRRFLTAYMPLVDAKGWVPWIVFEGETPVTFVTDSREGHEYDSQGQFPFLARHYVAFSHDDALLQEVYPIVVRALQYGKQLRHERMVPKYRENPQWTAYYGILPESNSHEGYFPAVHSYWDDFWYLRGLKDGIDLASRLGREADSAWMRAELKDAQQALYASMRQVIERDQLDYLPGSVEKGDFDATSTAIAIMISDEGTFLPQPYAAHTFNRYYEKFVKRLIPGGAKRFTPYEVRNAEVFIRLGERQRALNLLRSLTYDASRPSAWNHLAEVVHETYRMPSYIGDMPHTWVGSGYINAVRSLFAYEEADQLILAAGIDPAWIKEGIEVRHLPTLFGVLHYDLRDAAGRVRMRISGEAAPPGGFVVRLPHEFRTQVARLNGKVIAHSDASFQFVSLPVTIELEEREKQDRDG